MIHSIQLNHQRQIKIRENCKHEVDLLDRDTFGFDAKKDSIIASIVDRLRIFYA